MSGIESTTLDYSKHRYCVFYFTSCLLNKAPPTPILTERSLINILIEVTQREVSWLPY